MKITQEQLIKKYIKEYGEFIPAKRANSKFRIGWFGSEVGRVCRYMRKEGLLWSERTDENYAVFYPTKKLLTQFKKNNGKD